LERLGADPIKIMCTVKKIIITAKNTFSQSTGKWRTGETHFFKSRTLLRNDVLVNGPVTRL
jgi:hypothetical protein